MILLRAATNEDLEGIIRLAQQAAGGITTLPDDKGLLERRLAWSSVSFNTAISGPRNERYLFVLEDTAQAKVIGTSAIEAVTGHSAPFYSFKLSTHNQASSSLKIHSEYSMLTLSCENAGCSELCTLFLDKDYRSRHNGALLSKGRFLFMAENPRRFLPMVLAEMRGVSDEAGISPFWDGLGRHFFHMSFREADRLTIASDKQFIADLMPTAPIYVPLLAKSAQEVIAKAHPATIPALAMLEQESFQFTQFIDIFDGGPSIFAPFESIRSIVGSRHKKITKIYDHVTGPSHLISTTQGSFRATVSNLDADEKNASCAISTESAKLLNVSIGDTLRTVPLSAAQGT